MKWKPYPYQLEIMSWLDEKPEAMIWAGCGLGKTVTSLSVVSNLILEGAAKGALVIAPKRVLATSYPSQVERWDHLNWLRVANMRTPEGQKAWERASADIYLINSEMLPTITRNVKCKVCKGNEDGCDNCNHGISEQKTPGFVDRFIKGRKTIPVDILIVDEISIARNPSSVRFNALRPYLHDIEKLDGKKNFKSPFTRKIGLTGTPHPNSYLDLFAQVRLIDGGKRFGTAFTRYRDQYFAGDYMGFRYDIRPGSKEIIDEKLSDLALVMRSEDYLDLPPCITEDIEVTLPAAAMKAYRVLEKELIVELDTGTITALSAAALTTKLTQLTSGSVLDAERGIHVTHDAKLDALRKLVKKHAKEPILVFTSYIHERERILAEFPQARQFDEKDMVLWQKGKIPIWVSDARSLAFGIDGLQVSGRICVWMTQTYSWEVYHQAVSRIVRTGQEQNTIVYRLLATDTVDEAIVTATKAKEEGNSGLMEAIKNLRRLKSA